MHPRGIGSAPIKYALHFIGQAFHGAGREMRKVEPFREGVNGKNKFICIQEYVIIILMGYITYR